MICFGTMHSRRFGRSLGINNIRPPKKCTYSCIYCQIGDTTNLITERQQHYEPEKISREVEKHLEQLQDTDRPDYLTFVSNGEPTLDQNLGRSIRLIRKFGVPVAVITNGSLLSQASVREDLKLADCVSVKADAADELLWGKLNRPPGSLDFKIHLEGLLRFSQEYHGKLITETMLVRGINDQRNTIENIAELISRMKPFMAYLSIPTRPPALKDVAGPEGQIINMGYQIFSQNGLNTGLLIGFEGTDTGNTGNAEEDILNICAVHPIRDDTMMELLAKNGACRDILDKLLEENKIQKVIFQSEYYYLRNLNTEA